ncbi:unnamed protein product, partial [marine sediment metagenome]
EFNFYVGVRLIKPEGNFPFTGRMNPLPTLKAILNTKKILSFELMTIHY